MAVDVTRTMQSCGLRIDGSGTFSTPIFCLPCQQTALISTPRRSTTRRLSFHGGNLVRLHELLETPQIFTNERVGGEAERFSDRGEHGSAGRLVVEYDAHLGAAVARCRTEVHGAGMCDIRIADGLPRDQ